MALSALGKQRQTVSAEEAGLLMLPEPVWTCRCVPSRSAHDSMHRDLHVLKICLSVCIGLYWMFLCVYIELPFKLSTFLQCSFVAIHIYASTYPECLF